LIKIENIKAEMGGKTNGETLENCYRNTGSVPVPRKFIRKTSAPESPRPAPSVQTRKVSCPPIQRKPELKLLRATEEKCIFKEEVPSDLIPADLKKSESRAKQCVEGSSGASLCSIVNHKPKIQLAVEKAETTEPELKKELKRGSMKEKWGLTLVYRVDKSRICLSAKKVSMFSAAAKAGIAVGDTLVTINDWNIEAMDNIQV